MEALQTLPGVGRRTANVVLANAFGVPTIAVDTHVFRVSNRLGLADANTVEKTEEPLMKAIPEKGLGGRPPLADLPWPAECATPETRSVSAAPCGNTAKPIMRATRPARNRNRRLGKA